MSHTTPLAARARAWWPVGRSIVLYVLLIFVPVLAVYLLATKLGVPGFVGLFLATIVIAAVMTILEFRFGSQTESKVINHTDVASMFFGTFVTSSIGNGIVIVLLAPLSDSISSALGTQLWPSSWPLFIQVVFGLVIADLVMYPIHRYMHSHDSLWRVHVVHHSVRDLRPVRAALQHPFEVLLLGVVPAIPFVIFGAPAMVAILVGTIRVTVGIVDHSSMPLRTGWLDYVIHTPNDHWWHHNLEDRGGTNFTTVVIELDILFRSFKKPPKGDPVPNQIGIAEPVIDQNRYARQLAVPFRWKRVKTTGHS